MSSTEKTPLQSMNLLPKHPVLSKLLERGIPVNKAEFHAAVNNADQIPETMFSSGSNAKSRNVKMWWINGDGLLCFHKEKYFLVPSASVKYVNFD